MNENISCCESIFFLRYGHFFDSYLQLFCCLAHLSFHHYDSCFHFMVNIFLVETRIVLIWCLNKHPICLFVFLYPFNYRICIRLPYFCAMDFHPVTHPTRLSPSPPSPTPQELILLKVSTMDTINRLTNNYTCFSKEGYLNIHIHTVDTCT